MVATQSSPGMRARRHFARPSPEERGTVTGSFNDEKPELRGVDTFVKGGSIPRRLGSRILTPCGALGWPGGPGCTRHLRAKEKDETRRTVDMFMNPL